MSDALTGLHFSVVSCFLGVRCLGRAVRSGRFRCNGFIRGGTLHWDVLVGGVD